MKTISQEQIKTIKEEYDNILNLSLSQAAKIRTVLEGLSDTSLGEISKSKIKFVSQRAVDILGKRQGRVASGLTPYCELMKTDDNCQDNILMWTNVCNACKEVSKVAIEKGFAESPCDLFEYEKHSPWFQDLSSSINEGNVQKIKVSLKNALKKLSETEDLVCGVKRHVDGVGAVFASKTAALVTEVKPSKETIEYRVGDKSISFFLCGAIDQGKADDWQSKVANFVKEKFDDGTGVKIEVLNPRRDEWDSSWEQVPENDLFSGQVKWELGNLDSCNFVFVGLPKDSKAPISLLELGLMLNQKKCIVWCEEGFYRSGNVIVTCDHYDKFDPEVFSSFDDALSCLEKEIDGFISGYSGSDGEIEIGDSSEIEVDM